MHQRIRFTGCVYNLKDSPCKDLRKMFSGGVEKDRHILYLVMIKLNNDMFDPICIGHDIQLAFNIRQIYPKDFVR
jgi:hypothetical protein